MNAYDLPSSLTVGGRVYAIRTGWRTVIDIFSAMGFDNGAAHRQTDTHVVPAGIYRRFAVQDAGKQMGQPFLRNAAAVIFHTKNSAVLPQLYPQPQILHVVGVKYRVFQQIH